MMNKNIIPEELQRIRDSIDRCDAALIRTLAERFRCTQAVGQLKAQYQLPPSDTKREKQQTERLRALASENGLDPDFAERFLRFIITEVVQNHKDIATQHNGKNAN